MAASVDALRSAASAISRVEIGLFMTPSCEGDAPRPVNSLCSSREDPGTTHDNSRPPVSALRFLLRPAFAEARAYALPGSSRPLADDRPKGPQRAYRSLLPDIRGPTSPV